MNIANDETLSISADHIEVKLVDGVLRTASPLHALLRRHGVRDASYIISLVDEMPSLISSALGTSETGLSKLRADVLALVHNGVEPPINDFVTPPYGAMTGKFGGNSST